MVGPPFCLLLLLADRPPKTFTLQAALPTFLLQTRRTYLQDCLFPALPSPCEKTWRRRRRGGGASGSATGHALCLTTPELHGIPGRQAACPAYPLQTPLPTLPAGCACSACLLLISPTLAHLVPAPSYLGHGQGGRRRSWAAIALCFAGREGGASPITVHKWKVLPSHLLKQLFVFLSLSPQTSLVYFCLSLLLFGGGGGHAVASYQHALGVFLHAWWEATQA